LALFGFLGQAPFAMNTALSSLACFVMPLKTQRGQVEFERQKVCAIIPAYNPGECFVSLVEDLLRWNPNIMLYIVDDSTPISFSEAHSIFRRVKELSSRVILLRTPYNSLKAGALNFALAHIKEWRNSFMPDVIITLDDDVVITKDTVHNLVVELLSYSNLGAVCSQCAVYNKNKNILTRLQALEYVGFNATRLADEGFYKGPLVMHGMLTAFRSRVLLSVGGFADKHLIEDYEITTRLKAAGWSVKVAVNAPAWTIVPETMYALQRQRARWSYGGILVLTKTKYPLAVLQDLIGHTMFIATIIMIDMLIVVQFLGQGSYGSPVIASWIIALSFTQLFAWYAFQLWLMRHYKEKDIWDWVLRLSIVPEFLYCNLLTLNMLGSYLFLIFNVLNRTTGEGVTKVRGTLEKACRNLFGVLGYTEGWGTRSS